MAGEKLLNEERQERTVSGMAEKGRLAFGLEPAAERAAPGLPAAGGSEDGAAGMTPGRAALQASQGRVSGALKNATFIRPVDEEQCRKWNERLTKYKSAKHQLDRRVIDAEEWWRMRNEFQERKETDAGDSDMEFRSKSAWLFNVIASKHADYIAAYPMANIRARAEDDKGEAYMLTKIIPVILQQARFKRVYDLNGWQKLKTGCGIYKVFWDKNAERGLGNIRIVRRSLLNVFWDPGVTDIQQSKEFFDVEMVDRETLLDEYPELEDRELGSAVVPEKIISEETMQEQEKIALIEVYYKRRGILHYAKYVGTTVLYATENDNEILGEERNPATGIIEKVHTRAADGLYDHGLYPYVFDVLYPVENSPAGFGNVDVCANAMTRIDMLNQAMLENAEFGSTPRYFARSDGNINMKEFLNVKQKIVHVPGPVDDSMLRPIDTPQLSGNHIAVQNAFISELRETSGNTEAGNGIAQSGVTAASAYAALQEASGKLNRASTDTTYDAYQDISYLVIELIRQFFVAPRMFRIMGDMGTEKYISFSNEGMLPKWQGMIGDQDMGYRLPEYDIEVVPESKLNYNKRTQNELAMELYGKGFFNPENADQALACLDMMDFDDKDETIRKVAQNGTMLQELRQWQQLALQLAQQFAPAMVPGLAGAVTGDQSGIVAYGEDVAKAGVGVQGGTVGEEEPAIVQKARQRANEASQPGGSSV